MKPPEAPKDGNSAAQGINPPAVLSRIVTLCKRADFQRASRATHVAMPGFVLQMRKRRDAEGVAPDQVRIGYTCSKKVGNAVKRNRAKRRLREIARQTLPQQGIPGHDYVLIGRRDATADLCFDDLQRSFMKALHILHGTKS